MKLKRSQTMDAILSTRRRSLMLGGLGLGTLGALALASRRIPGTVDGKLLHFSGETMGSTYNVKLVHPSTDLGGLQQEVHAALDAVDRRMSMFRADSELSAFNRAGRAPFTMSAELFEVFAAAQEISRWSDGAFDITVAPLVEAWGFGTAKRRAVPADADLRASRAAVDWRGLALDPPTRTVAKARSSMQTDLGGIAQGYGVDAAAAVLDGHGVEHYLVEVSGEVRTRGLNAQGEPWRIGIEEPDAMPQRARHIVPLSGRSMATSGDYRNYFEQDGQRYSHEIDPATGAPIRHSLCSVTVIAASCMRADALATALIVLGPQRGLALAEAGGLAAQFIVRRGTDLVDEQTRAFAALGWVRA
jgi:thiamine biosynthesis lipoprotein